MWYLEKVKPLSEPFALLAKKRQNQLTKPVGSLGRLEEIAVRFASRQGKLMPQVDNVQITVFAGDHGIADEGVSAFPQVVTTEMVKNFVSGGAAITVLAKQWQAGFEIVDVGIADPLPELEGLISESVGQGTKSFLNEFAMTNSECLQAMQVGKNAVIRAKKKGVELFIGGEMGIANTTSATAIACKLLDRRAMDLVGLGTGISDEVKMHKVKIIEKSLMRTRSLKPLEVLENYGGFEIAALTGAYIASAQQGISVLVDGFICSVAALVAIKLNPDVILWLEFSHKSAEKGHKFILKYLGVKPLLNLNMRLGEASGSAIALPILQSACALHKNMATFEEASVSTK